MVETTPLHSLAGSIKARSEAMAEQRRSAKVQQQTQQRMLQLDAVRQQVEQQRAAACAYAEQLEQERQQLLKKSEMQAQEAAQAVERKVEQCEAQHRIQMEQLRRELQELEEEQQQQQQQLARVAAEVKKAAATQHKKIVADLQKDIERARTQAALDGSCRAAARDAERSQELQAAKMAAAAAGAALAAQGEQLAALELKLLEKEQAEANFENEVRILKGTVAKLQKRDEREVAAEGRTAEQREGSTTIRSELLSLQRSLAAERKERANALAANEDLRRAVEKLEAKVSLGRGQQREAAPVTEQSKAEQRVKAVAAAEAAGLVVVHPLKDGDRFSVRTLEAVRRLSTVCHVPGKHVASVIDHVFSLLTRTAPTDEYQAHERIDAVAHRTLGIEDELQQQDSSSEKYGG